MNRPFRLLPLLALSLIVIFALRAGELWTGVSAVGKAWAEGASKAKENPGVPAAHPATQVEEHPLPAPAPVSGMDGGIPTLNGQAPAAPDHSASPAAQAHSADDPASPNANSSAAEQPRSSSRPSIPGEDAFVSPAEIQVLESLTRRREDLDKRAAALDMREKLLVATEQRLDQKLGEIQKVETAIKASLRTLSEEEAAQIASLVKVYETMKPKEAAAIFQGLDRKILIDVTAHMKEAKMSAILAAMEPEKARELTVLLATRVEIPGLGTTASLGKP
jgi:flagellar motility protein MotE (MotC chaperone)